MQYHLVISLSEIGFLHKNCISSSLIQIDVRKSHRWLCTELLIQSFFFLLGLGLKVPGHLANYSRGSQDWLNLLSHIERISIHAKLLFCLEQFGNLKICRC